MGVETLIGTAGGRRGLGGFSPEDEAADAEIGLAAAPSRGTRCRAARWPRRRRRILAGAAEALRERASARALPAASATLQPRRQALLGSWQAAPADLHVGVWRRCVTGRLRRRGAGQPRRVGAPRRATACSRRPQRARRPQPTRRARAHGSPRRLPEGADRRRRRARGGSVRRHFSVTYACFSRCCRRCHSCRCQHPITAIWLDHEFDALLQLARRADADASWRDRPDRASVGGVVQPAGTAAAAARVARVSSSSLTSRGVGPSGRGGGEAGGASVPGAAATGP